MRESYLSQARSCASHRQSSTLSSSFSKKPEGIRVVPRRRPHLCRPPPSGASYHSISRAPYHLRLPMRHCSLATPRCKLTMQRCRLTFPRCGLTMQRCTLCFRIRRPPSYACPASISSRYRAIRSRFVPRLENCFSHTSLNRARTLRLMDSWSSKIPRDR